MAGDEAGREPWGTFLAFPAIVVFVISPIAHAMHAWGWIALPFNPGSNGIVATAFQLLALGSPAWFTVLALYWWATKRRMRALLSMLAIGIWAIASALLFYMATACIAGCNATGSLAMFAAYGISLLGMSFLAHSRPPPEGNAEDAGHEHEPA